MVFLMAKCDHCTQRKGRRTCPAIGVICSSCCGRHRQREIDCPPTCVYLPATEASAAAAFAGAQEKLLDFAASRRWPALQAGVDEWVGAERSLPVEEMPSQLGYLCYGARDDAGDRLVDIFLSRHGDELTAREREALTCLDDAWVSLFGVVRVERDRGLALGDVLTGDELFVRERAGTRSIESGQLLLAWVVPIEGEHYFTGAISHVPQVRAPIAFSLLERHGLAPKNPNGTPAVRPASALAVRGIPPRLLPELHRAMREWDLPEMHTPEGERVESCFSSYEVKDVDRVRAHLASASDIEPVADGLYLWRDDESVGGEPIARVELRTVRLSLAVHSRERLARARRMIEARLGPLVEHRADQVQSLGELFAEMEAGSASDVEPRPGPERRDDGAAPLTSPDRTTHRLPPAAHEVMVRFEPGLGEMVDEFAAGLRSRWGPESSRTLSQGELAESAQARAFLETYVRRRIADGYARKAAVDEASFLGEHLAYLVNFELHRRKLFWVDEAVAWMLGRTEMDVRGRLLEVPFPSFAVVFSDRATLELGESLVCQDLAYSSRDAPLAVLTVYVSRETDRPDGGHGLRLSFLFDPRTPTSGWPYLVGRDLYVRPDDTLQEIVDSHFPEVVPDALDPIFYAPELKKLTELVLHAILYATSAHLEPVLLRPERRSTGKRRRRRRKPAGGGGGPGLYSDEEVFYLPGHIDIGQVRQLQNIEKQDRGGKLMTRFLVRGHWRRAPAHWKDQRLRWIKPHWKGPDMATIVERQYRLKP